MCVRLKKMKRDFDLIRRILFIIEASEQDPIEWVEINIEGKSPTEIAYHIWLLVDAGLIEGTDCSSGEGLDWKAQALTWEGHEFLQSIKSDNIWNKAKEKILKPSVSWTFGILTEYLKQEIKKQIGIES